MLNRVRNRFRDRSLAEIGRLVVLNIRHTILLNTPKNRSARAADLAFDRRWGTDTSTGEGTRELGYTGDLLIHAKRYDPSSEGMLHQPLAALALDPARYDFIDYGAGKGRVLMMAMELGFRSVTGIELSDRLCESARRNVARFAAQHPGMKPADIIAANASHHRPTGDFIVAYFYNPFDATIMTEVRTCLERAVDEGARNVVVIYANPEHDAVFRDAPRWLGGPTLPGIATFSLGGS